MSLLFSELYGLVADSCAPYLMSTLFTTCSHYAHCPIQVRIASSYYLGGHYGGQVADTTMMREIRAKGPITVDLNVPPGFGLYKEGILTEDGLEEIRRMMRECNGESDLIWEYVNHSVAIIGWGVDRKSGMKFWICRNSYGSQFGE